MVCKTQVRRSRVVEPPPEPKRRVQYVPYEEKYVDYVEKKVKVPVQKEYTDYYEIEHIIDYIPIEKYDVVYQTEPQEVVNMKLMYVPVETYPSFNLEKSFTLARTMPNDRE